MARHGAVLGPEVERAMVEAGARPVPRISLPADPPLVPLRNALLSVGAIAPIVVGREASIAAVHAAEAGSRLVAMFTQTVEANESPGAGDLHPVGCVAELCAVVPSGVSPASPVLAKLEGAPLPSSAGNQLTIVL
jgi:ATP-dependent Lon protease